MSTKMINEKEIYISVDPVSMKEVEYPIYGVSKPETVNKPLHTLPKRNKFLSASLSSSTCTSPREVIQSKGKDYYQALERGSPKSHSLSHRHSLASFHLVLLKEMCLQKNKSCDEERPSIQYDEFDLGHTSSKTSSINVSVNSTPRGQTCPDSEYCIITASKKRNEDDFKCRALCLYLPTFGKVKPVRGRKVVREEIGHVISKRVSLEKFECGSWRSSGILDGANDFLSNLYFDLPLELIQMSGNDANLPVSSAFVFDEDVKGVLNTKKEEK